MEHCFRTLLGAKSKGEAKLSTILAFSKLLKETWKSV